MNGKPRMKTAFALSIACLALLLSACAPPKAYQADERPAIRVDTSQQPPLIHWTPNNAHILRVYEGTPKQGFGAEGLIWVLNANQTNGLQSPITYGVVPEGGYSPKAAAPLLGGGHYTVSIRRKDPHPNPERSGLSDVLHVYEAQETFTMPRVKLR